MSLGVLEDVVASVAVALYDLFDCSLPDKLKIKTNKVLKSWRAWMAEFLTSSCGESFQLSTYFPPNIVCTRRSFDAQLDHLDTVGFFDLPRLDQKVDIIPPYPARVSMIPGELAADLRSIRERYVK